VQHAVLWLETYLQSWGKTLVVVSHARSFLNNVCTDMLHFVNKSVTRYKGDYDHFEVRGPYDNNNTYTCRLPHSRSPSLRLTLSHHPRSLC
jgi:ATPase subunit of ABC transporter with duplicated ATPase domains